MWAEALAPTPQQHAPSAPIMDCAKGHSAAEVSAALESLERVLAMLAMQGWPRAKSIRHCAQWTRKIWAVLVSCGEASARCCCSELCLHPTRPKTAQGWTRQQTDAKARVRVPMGEAVGHSWAGQTPRMNCEELVASHSVPGPRLWLQS